MLTDTWLGRSRQEWKILLFVFLMAVEGLAFLLFLWRLNYPDALTAFVPSGITLGFFFMGLGGQLFYGYGSRCGVLTVKRP